MSYFSRLSDIVTCNLSEILASADDARAAVEQIIREMEEGVAGARRSVATAANNEQRLEKELHEYRMQIEHWATEARREMAAGREDQARLTLLRKQEIEDVVAGLTQQHQAAIATRDHLQTTLRALEARLAEALRKRQELQTGQPIAEPAPAVAIAPAGVAGKLDESRARKVEEELEAIRRELSQPH